MARKKSMGKRKIAIQKIENKESLQVTFSKRRMGIFKKASELSILCGAEIAILVQSPAQKIFAFGSPTVEMVLGRFERGEASSSSPLPPVGFWPSHIRVWETNQIRCAEATMRLEKEKERRMKENVEESGWWWYKPIEEMELYELEDFLDAMEGLRANVVQRLAEMLENNLKVGASTTSYCLPDLPADNRQAELRANVQYTQSGFTATPFCGQEFDGGWQNNAVDNAVVPSMQNENVTAFSDPADDGIGDFFLRWEYVNPTSGL